MLHATDAALCLLRSHQMVGELQLLTHSALNTLSVSAELIPMPQRLLGKVLDTLPLPHMVTVVLPAQSECRCESLSRGNGLKELQCMQLCTS